MAAEHWERVEELFRKAVNLPADERAAFLERACGGDRELLTEVGRLLAEDDGATSPLPPAEFNVAALLAQAGADDPNIGEQIGAYRIIELLGEGGFGVVYLAEQTEPLHRLVAVKVIKPGMDTREIVRRFEAERQMLAVMDHPCIAKVFDAGATERGLPYFVMDYVEGEPITQFCDRQCLGVEQRLDLFITVCEAVQHAHIKGVIHRDLKPSNILVACDASGQPRPKVIDFGVAKALDQRLGTHTVFTGGGQLIGTPAYMSPEQAGTSGLDIDTRADVYSLGVVLYELLTGVRPFDRESRRHASPEEVQQIVREEEPAKPSTRLASVLTTQMEQGSTIAKARGTDVRTLRRRLRGDLDWILLKCLERDRERRYDTAHSLALDLRRHLRHEPVEAGPPSLSYRMRKFVRRNRGMVGAATAAAVALVCGLISTTIFAVRASRQAAEARFQQAVAIATMDALGGVFSAADPSEQQGRGDLTIRAYVDELAQRLESNEKPGFLDNPDPLIQQLLEIGVRNHVARTYTSLAEYGSAEGLLRRSLEQAGALGARGRLQAAQTQYLLADVLLYKGDYHGAQSFAADALQGFLALNEPVRALDAKGILAAALKSQGDFAGARVLQEECLVESTRLFGRLHRRVAKGHLALGMMDTDSWLHESAERHLREGLSILRELAGTDQDAAVAEARFALARLLDQDSRLDEGRAELEAALHTHETLYGPDHPSVGAFLHEIGVNAFKRRDLEAAYQATLRAVQIREKRLGPNHERVAASLQNLGSIRSNWAAMRKVRSTSRGPSPSTPPAATELTKSCDAGFPWPVV